jgi:ATP-dependent Lon protease
MQEKLVIARRFLLPRRIAENGLAPKDVTMADEVMQAVIEGYTREAGLRNLERELGSLCRKTARKKAEGVEGPFAVTPAMARELLGAPRFTGEERETLLPPGVAMGLAWTPFGGEVLSVEVSTMKGKGTLTLTGQLGDVMKESAQAAVSYARANAEALNVDPCFTEDRDIHIHVPAGATPKDGPSAGVTIAAALVSALSGKPVNPALCMTGEITLRGRVLPVGGVKEKILAGVARGFTDVIIPKQNVKDLEEIPKDLLEKIAAHPVDLLDDAFRLAFSASAPKAGARGAKPPRKAAAVPGHRPGGAKPEKEKRAG